MPKVLAAKDIIYHVNFKLTSDEESGLNSTWYEVEISVKIGHPEYKGSVREQDTTYPHCGVVQMMCQPLTIPAHLKNAHIVNSEKTDQRNLTLLCSFFLCNSVNLPMALPSSV